MYFYLSSDCVCGLFFMKREENAMSVRSLLRHLTEWTMHFFSHNSFLLLGDWLILFLAPSALHGIRHLRPNWTCVLSNNIITFLLIRPADPSFGFSLKHIVIVVIFYWNTFCFLFINVFWSKGNGFDVVSPPAPRTAAATIHQNWHESLPLLFTTSPRGTRCQKMSAGSTDVVCTVAWHVCS